MIDFDDCASSPCMNGGTCRDQLGGFTCSCVDGYSGPTCNAGIALPPSFDVHPDYGGINNVRVTYLLMPFRSLGA